MNNQCNKHTKNTNNIFNNTKENKNAYIQCAKVETNVWEHNIIFDGSPKCQFAPNLSINVRPKYDQIQKY